MPIPTFTKLGPNPSFSDIVTKVNTLVGEMTNLMLNLDSLNVTHLTAETIDTGTLNANLVKIRSDLTAGAYIQLDGNGLVINNGSFNTFTADIDGNVTMTSALVQSSTGFPRVVMDPTTELFGAYATAAKFINILANDSGDPLLYFENDVSLSRIAMIADLLSISSFARLTVGSVDDLKLTATGSTSDVILEPGANGQVTVPTWSKFINATSNQTLQTALDAKANSGVATGSAGSHNHGISDGRYLMTYDSVGTQLGLQEWNTALAHTHTQN